VLPKELEIGLITLLVNIIIMKKIILYISLLLPNLVSAEEGASMNTNFKFKSPIGATSFSELIYNMLDAIVKIGAGFVVLFIVYAGFLFVLARGNESQITKAKSIFYWTILGAIILLGAEALSQVVCNTANQLGAGVDCLFRN
jgi:hypothetical protein